jgi:hypothetical protein
MPGTGGRGPRVLNFSPILQLAEFPVNDAVRKILGVCESHLNAKVEIEMAMTFPATREGSPRLGFL